MRTRLLSATVAFVLLLAAAPALLRAKTPAPTAPTAPTGPTTKPIGPNLAANGGFEQGGWAFSVVGAQATGAVVDDVAHSGKHSFKITNKSGFAPNVYARAYQVVTGLEPFTTYRISCYVKGTDIGICWIGGGPGWYHRQHFPKGTYDWTYVETLWTTDANAGDFELMVCTESQTKALYVDDVKMEPIATDTAKRDAVLAKYNAARDAQLAHFRDVHEKVLTTPGASADPVIHLGIAVARRFLDRVTSTETHQSRQWSIFQLEEIDQVLKTTEHQLDRFRQRAGNAAPAAPQPYPLGGPVAVHDGTFHTDTTAAKDQPWYFYGMGHFDQLYKELPFWHQIGASMLQDGRVGPNGMEKDGSLRAPAKTLLADFDRASLYNLKVDYLLSPHYFPDWAWNLPGADELRKLGMGFLYFDIDHPIARDAIGRWADIISKNLKGKPALFSVCLSNEPVWNGSGRSKYSLGLYQKYLQNLHHDIATLNDLYGTHYKSFDEIDPPPAAFAKEVGKNRAYYDWSRFNKKHFADWQAWMASIVHKNLPGVPTHAKIMVFLTMDRDKVGWGVDPELMCAATDLAGCDAYAFPSGDHKTYDWRGEEFWYDLLNSFRNQPVFNSENHIIPDGTGPAHIPPTMTRAQYWQGALHHQGVTTTWVWEQPGDASLTGSIFFRPGNTYGAGRAFLDLGRHASEVAAINAAPPRVALLYSQPSIFWENNYFGTILNIYTHLTFLGEKVTFISETALAQGRIPPSIQCIVLPQATHVENATVDALRKFASAGKTLVQIGNDNLKYDQYHRDRTVPTELASSRKFEFSKDAADTQRALADLLKSIGAAPLELTDASTGKLAWNVEYRAVDHDGATLMPIINFAANPVTVSFPSLSGKKATDLLSGDGADLAKLKLDPMVPMLLRVQEKK
jgi:hypothetical protein